MKGALTIGKWQGIPIRIHWSAPVAAFLMGRFQWVPAFWAGFFLLILIHELGHAWVVKRARARVIDVVIHGMGGECAWTGRVSAVERACISWGGVWAQGLALAATLLYLAIAGEPMNREGAQLVDVFTRSNLWLIAINLIPIAPLDGKEAWRLVPLLKERGMKRLRVWRYTKASAETRRTLQELDDAEPESKPPKEIEVLIDGLLEDAKKPRDPRELH